MERDPDVTICIATYRRPEGLARMLESLGRVEVPSGVRAEIVVVDDDPAGEGARVAEKFDGAPHPVRALVLGGANVAGARNRAVGDARGSWIAFLDDDEAVEPGWLAAHWTHRGADGSFGPVVPRLEGGGTPWIDAETFFARPRHPCGQVLGRANLRTGNALVRGALLRANRFDPDFGLSGGEDSDLLGRLVDGGARFEWCDSAIVHEWIPAGRRTAGWLAGRAFRGGLLSTRIERRRRGTAYPWIAAARALLAGAALSLALPPSALFGRARVLRVALRACVQAGHLWCLVGGAVGRRG